MPAFCLWDHPQIKVCLATVEPQRPRPLRRDGFRLRYAVALPSGSDDHADDVISRLDAELSAHRRAHGVYQMPYDDLRAAYGRLLDEARPPKRPGQLLARALALLLAAAMLSAMCFLAPLAAFGFLLFAALRRQSGFSAMFEAYLLADLLDWRPTIGRLVGYGIGRK